MLGLGVEENHGCRRTAVFCAGNRWFGASRVYLSQDRRSSARGTGPRYSERRKSRHGAYRCFCDLAGRRAWTDGAWRKEPKLVNRRDITELRIPPDRTRDRTNEPAGQLLRV